MHSSGPGANASGASNSLSSQNPNAQHEATQSRQQLGSAPLSQGVQAHSSSLDSHNWFDYATQVLSSSSLPHHSSAGPSASSTMIGSTSTFFDPETSLQQVDDDGQPYQQWVNSYSEQQYRGISPYTNFMQNYPPAAYPEFIANTVTPTASQYQQQTQHNTPDNSRYTSELLNATTGPVTATPGSTPDTGQVYQHSTPDSALHSYTNTPDPQVHSASQQQVYQTQQQTQSTTTQKNQAMPRSNQRQIPPEFQGQPQHAAPPQAPHQRTSPSSQHQHQPPSQQYHQTQGGSPSAHQRPSAAQSYSQEPGNNSRELSTRKQPRSGSNSPYTTNQLNIQLYQPKSQPSSSNSPTPTVRADQPNTNGRPAPRANASGSGANGSQAARSSQKLATASGPSKRPTKHTNAFPHAPSPTGANSSKRRKRDYEGNFVAGEGDTEGESDGEEGEGFTVGLAGLGVVTADGKVDKGQRPPGACKHCKKLKMKCDFPKNDDTCSRCKAGGHVCIVEGRKPRTAPNKREYLLAQIRQKDAIIESLLKQLHNPYLATPLSIASYRMATSPSDQGKHNVLAWLDRLQSSVRDAGTPAGPEMFTELQNKADAESDGESDTPGIEFVTPDDDEQEGDGNSSEAEKIQNSLPDAHVPLGLIANMSINSNHVKCKKDRGKDLNISDEDLNDDNVGVANETYFMPGPAFDLNRRAMLIEQHSPPEILVHGLVDPDDVQNLFDIFYKYVNPFISLLDPVLHTPASTFARCPFLFTVVCAISSRYYVEKSEIYPIAMHFAKHSAANALIDGWKSVELCQAYILMSIYAVPAKRWEEDRSWLYTGLAIRIATDLNLHQASTTKAKDEKEEREALNRARVWMICYNLDRSTATQFGKPSTIKEDYIVRNARGWYKKSPYNLSHDVHLCAYSALLQIVARFHDEIFSDPSAPSGLNKNVDFRKITMKHDEFLTQYHNEWLKRFEESSDPNNASCIFRCSLLPFYVSYSRLVMFSFGFQQAFQRGIERSDQVFFTKCLEAAKSVIKNMIDGLAPSGYMRYAPDGHFVFASFASAFLLKLLRPEFATLLSKEQESSIFELIGRLIQTLSSPKIAIDDRHTPKLYARFLAGLLSRHRRDGATVGRLHPNPPSQQQNGNGNTIPAGSMTTFSVAQQSQSSTQPNQDLGYNANGVQQSQTIQTPIYRQEATYDVGTGHIHFGSDMELAVMDVGYSADEEMLATMQAIKNPSWWQNMMMPGFSWSPDPSPSPPHVMGQQAPQPPPSYHPAMHRQNIAMPHALHPGFNAYQAVQVPMP